jgi:hypothetical protein
MKLRRLTLACCVLALGVAGCGNDEEQGVDEPAREGLALELDGIDYNVFITRELNARITPDKAYITEEAPPGESLYGIFIQACNHSDEPRETVSDFAVVDNQNNRFEPKELPEDNPFAYSPKTLNPQECIPEAGSVAQQGPATGSMLLFQFPIQNTENRPLELEIEGENGKKLTYELDI